MVHDSRQQWTPLFGRGDSVAANMIVFDFLAGKDRSGSFGGSE